MKALFAIRSVLAKIDLVSAIALLIVVPTIYPELAFAAELSKTAQAETAIIFEIKNPSVLLQKKPTSNSPIEQIAETVELASIEDIQNSDPLVVKLTDYLNKHNSPLAEYAPEIVKQPQWQRSLAISWVESNFGKRCYTNNCSGIGVAPGHPLWRSYATKLDWFKDMCQLMEKPMYKVKYTTFEQMRGIYVYPGSSSWVNGAKKKYAELMEITTQAEQEKLAAVEVKTHNDNLHTFPELAIAR